MNFSEHLLFFLLAFVLPYFILPKPVEGPVGQIDFSGPSVHKLYIRNTIVWLIVAAFVPYLVVEKAGNPLSAIWLDYNSWNSSDFLLGGLFGLGATGLVLIGALNATGRKILVSNLWSRNTKHQPRLPTKKPEFLAYPLLEVSEAFSAEVVYRAFVIYYLAHFMPVYFAAALSVPIFIWSEWFRGRTEALIGGLYGLFCAVLLLATNGILAPLFFSLGLRFCRLALAVKNRPKITG